MKSKKSRKKLDVGISDNSYPDVEALKNRLIEEDKFLTMLVDTIPAKMYFDQDMQEKITAEKHMSMNKTAEGLKRKFPKHPELSSKNKHMRARLNPLLQKSVSEIHHELSQQKTKKLKKDLPDEPSSFTRAANIEELQKRLKDRLQELKAKRNSCTKADVVEKRRLINKMKNIKKKKKGKSIKPNAENNNSTPTKKPPKKAAPKPIFNKEGNVIYSKFDFSESGEKNVKKSEYAGKKSKSLLYKAEKEKEKIDNLRQSDIGKADNLVKKAAWRRAILKSEGVKVKDNIGLLKKSIKKEEKRKNKSTKMWEDRKEQMEKRTKARQEKRTTNIQSRKRDKLEHKMKRATKKGRVIPGF